MAERDDRQRLRAAALALGDLVDEVVFVGGTVTSLMITDPAAPPTRQTFDVDVVVNARTRAHYHLVEKRLQSLGFYQRPHEPVMCRWFRDDLVVDVMPDDADILGFSNRWYQSAFRHAQIMDVDGMELRVVSAVWFLATKVEAFLGRGNADFQASRDLEDIIAVVDGRPTIVEEIVAAPDDVRAYLRQQFAAWLADERFLIALVGHVAGDAERADVVRERMEWIG